MKTNGLNIKLPYGDISIASLLIAAVSGILLAVNFDVSAPYLSVSGIVLLNPAANIVRNIHYWSAQLFLVTLVMHIYEHLKKNNDADVKKGVWLRLAFGILAAFFVMLSGFILKGDSDSMQAHRILTSLLEDVPFAGKQIAFFVLGNESNFQVLYVQHIATATVFLFIITYEHSRKLWTNYKVISVTGAVLLLAGLFLNAPLHDGMNRIIKGPWYFAGLQEILHWSGNPGYVIAAAVLLFIAFSALPYLYGKNKDGEINYFETKPRRMKVFFLSVSVLYLLLTVFAFFFRGENWEMSLPWKNGNVTGISFNHSFSSDTLSGKQVNAVLGRNEGCVYCHNNVKGLSASHDVKSFGCQSCHAGNPFTLNKTAAHENMFVIPGNLSNAGRTCGTANCHPDIAARVEGSLMNTMSGVVSVDKYVFGESKSTDEKSDIKKIGFSPAEKHLRNLCASCHLGAEKKETGEINELSRGGGCLACHLNYSDSSRREISNKEKIIHRFHPDVNLNITGNHCFGCHSRSGRIATNFEGWFETNLKPQDVKGKDGYRTLMDERVFEKKEADVHYDMGMTCVDCHLSSEVMGDGNTYLHKENAVKINCADCHPANEFTYAGGDKVDIESSKILALRKYKYAADKFIYVTSAGKVITNTFYDSASSVPSLFTKNGQKILPLKKSLPVCTEGSSHKRLYCGSCHTSRVSQCVSCHTEYKNNSEGFDLLDDKSINWEWVEHAGDIFNEAPALGIRFKVTGKGDTVNTVETFIPGMIVNITGAGNGNIFQRLYSPIRPHNTVRESRSCKSCHNNPVALGYGRGKLLFEVSGNSGRWTFVPEMRLSSDDGLPLDAWIGFMKNAAGIFSTRNNARPFNTEEQKKILTAGACLTCHEENSRVMNESLKDFESVKRRMTRGCAMPVY